MIHLCAAVIQNEVPLIRAESAGALSDRWLTDPWPPPVSSEKQRPCFL
jgi:hypothetical protein